MDNNQASLELHKKHHGKIAISPKVDIQNKEDLSLVYTPGVAAVSSAIAQEKELAYEYTWKGNTVAVVSDGSAVLGLGNIGPEAALPVMEGKCMIFKHFANIDAIPIVLDTQDEEEIIKTVVNLAPSFGGINLEDIAAPKCFEIERRLQEILPIPVIHDDQWGAAVVTLAGLYNALELVNKPLESVRIIILGAGAAGTGVIRLLSAAGAKNMIVCDQSGIIHKGRPENNKYKEEIADITNPNHEKGGILDAFKGADVFIGLSKGNTVTKEMVELMNQKPIIFALANPTPEISQKDALEAGTYIFASGRSDLPNQINNALVYPGLFRGALDKRIKKIDTDILLEVARILSKLVEHPNSEKIIPSIFDPDIVKHISAVVK